MSLFLLVANWLLVVFFGVAVVFLALGDPSRPVLAALNLLPFGVALIARRRDSKKSTSWFALVCNVIWLVFYLVVAAAVLVRGLGAVASVIAWVIAVVCFLNAQRSWRTIRAAA